MKLTDLQVVQITNALDPNKGILSQTFLYELRHAFRKILDQISNTYVCANKTRDEILTQKFNGSIQPTDKEGLKAFQDEWIAILVKSSSEYNIEKIPVELILQSKIVMDSFQDAVLECIINDPSKIKEEIKEPETAKE